MRGFFGGSHRQSCLANETVRGIGGRFKIAKLTSEGVDVLIRMGGPEAEGLDQGLAGNTGLDLNDEATGGGALVRFNRPQIWNSKYSASEDECGEESGEMHSRSDQKRLVL